MENGGNGSGRLGENEDSPRPAKRRKLNLEDHGTEHELLTIVDEALDFLKKAAKSASTSGGTKLAKGQYEIDLTIHKIEYCSQFLEKFQWEIDIDRSSYEQAICFIYFLDTFALEGSGDTEIKRKLEDNFCPLYYDTMNDLKIIREVRDHLLKHPARTLDLEDVFKCYTSAGILFFWRLNKFAQHVKTGKDQSNSLPLPKPGYALNDWLVNPEYNLEKEIFDVESFLVEEFDKWLIKAFGKEKLTWKDLFHFIINFYPIFEDKTKWGSKGLSDLRNRLLHQFHKYGHARFGNEIFAMRHELLKYQCAQKVYQVVCDIEPSDESEELAGRIEKQTKNLVKGEDEDQEVLLGAAEGFHAYKFSKSMLPEEVRNFEELAVQYLKFKFLTHNFVEEKAVEEEEEEDVDSIQAPNFQQQRRKLTDSDRREGFEEFSTLERLRKRDKSEYIQMKERFKNVSMSKYGVQASHFEDTYTFFEKNRGKFVDSDEAKEIVQILNILKDIREGNPKLSNQFIVLMYDRFVANNLNLKQTDRHDRKRIREKLKMLPGNRRIKLQINNTRLYVKIGEVIRDMLNIFRNAYNTYRVEFEIKDIFNDDTILDYMARNEAEEVDVEKLVDPFFKFIVTFDRDSVGLPRKEKVLEKFLLLKKIPHKSSNLFYNTEKNKLRIEMVVEGGVVENTFNQVCQRYIEGDDDLPNDEKEKVKQVRGIIGHLKRESKLPYREISCLYQRLIGGVNFSNYGSRENLLDGKTEDEKKFIGLILDIFLKHVPRDTHTSYDIKVFDQIESVVQRLGKFVGEILKTSEDKVQLKHHNYMRIKKLINIEYAAPYIARLITNARDDNLIEREDLKKLIAILMNGDEFSYVDHLNDLLHIDSRKLNLYEEVCTLIMKPSFNIGNMIVIFHEPKHVDGILTTLDEGINLSDGADKLMKKILKLLSNVVLELILFNDHETASIILDGELKKTYSRLRKDGKINNDDQLWVDYQLNIVRMKNAQGMYEEALKVLEAIPINKRQNLLVLRQTAYTHKLSKRYKEAYQMYLDLYKKIVKSVLNIDVSDPHDVDSIYRRIEGSEKYDDLLAASEESVRYLDILDVVKNIAYTLFKQGKTRQKRAEHDTAVEDLMKQSLKIYEGLYNYRKNEFGSTPEDTVKIMRHVARTHRRIGSLLLLSKTGKEMALQHSRDALVNMNRLKTQNYRIPLENINTHYIMVDMNNIARILNELGLALPNNDEKKAIYHTCALKIYENISDFQSEINPTQNDVFTFRSLQDIAYSHSYLLACEFLEPAERMANHAKAFVKFRELHVLAKTLYGDGHNLTLMAARYAKAISDALQVQLQSE